MAAKWRERAGRRAQQEERVAMFAAAIRELFPGCPPGEEDRIARYSCKTHTGRVGHVASLQGYLAEAAELAVVAHLRHRFSPYERLLGQGLTREQAREASQAEVSRLLKAWEKPRDPGQMT